MHFISKSPKEFDKCDYIVIFLKDNDINDVDESFCLYSIEGRKLSNIILRNVNLISFQ